MPSYADILADIAAAEKDAKRPVGGVALLAVSKFQPVEKIDALIAQGQNLFGENRVQEAVEKFPALREKHPGIRLHMIGHLQTNKVRDAVRAFDVIESVDSEKLASALADEMKKQSRDLPCFIQVNTGAEEQKDGVAPEHLPALLAHCSNLGITIEGLMCIPPEGDVPDFHFALLNKLAKHHGLAKLSMGMSADYKAAIRYGATEVRIGSALFDVRENK